MHDDVKQDFSEINDLDGLVTEDVGQVLYDYATQTPADQAIIELGSYHGKSTAYLAFGARQGQGQTVIAVDTWSEENSDWRSAVASRIASPTLEKFTEQLTWIGLIDQVTAYRGTTLDAAREYGEALKTKDVDPVGLLYVDADHSYDAVMADFEAWRGLMAPDGIMIFDDYTKTNPGVVRALRELRDSGRIKPIATRANRLVVANVGEE
jgi:predicted O-methyltransferase YrrM